jgi:hypothetical protein
MRITINIEEIELERVVEQGRNGGSRTMKFTFHDQIKIKKSFERELSRLFLDTKNDKNGDFSIESIFKNKSFFMSKNKENVNFIKEIDGGEISLPAGYTNPSELGKRLANSIYPSLNLVRAGSR